FCEPNRSVGFGGRIPRERKDNLLMDVGWTASSRGRLPANTFESPLWFVIPSRSWQLPFLRSASITKTFCPSCLKAIARFKVVRVFPSAGDGLVSKITFGGFSGCEKSKAVLMLL